MSRTAALRALSSKVESEVHLAILQLAGYELDSTHSFRLEAA